MIRYLIVLYLGIISIVLIDPNPLWALPLALVSIGQLWENKWLSIAGILTYSVVTVGRLAEGSFSDMSDLILLTLAVVLPIVILLEITLSSRPYKVQRISLIPTLITFCIIGAFSFLLFLIKVGFGPFDRIGVYLSSDPVLQLFILLSMAIFFTGPILLGSRPPEKGKGARH